MFSARNSLDFRLLLAFFSLSLSETALAQEQPPPDDAEPDLEVLAAPKAPTGTVPAPAPPQVPAASPQSLASPSAPAVAAKPTQQLAAESERQPAPTPLTSPAADPHALKISAYIQGQFVHNRVSEDQLQQGGAPLNQDQFMVRRGRISFDRTWKYAGGGLELDANTVRGPSVGIRRAEASLFYRGDNAVSLPPLVTLTVGVSDIPFGYELLESAKERWFMDRTVGSSALFPSEADLSAKLSGAYRFLRYALAVGNGEPLDSRGFPRDPNAAKDAVGRFGVDLSAAERIGLWGGTSFAYGKGFHAGTEATKDSVQWRDDNEDGRIDQGELVALPGRGAAPSENFARWAIGLDLGASLQTPLGTSRLYAEGFVASSYDRGFVPSDPVAAAAPIRQAGAYVALTQELWRHGIVGFRASFYDPNSDVIETRADKALPKTQTVKTFSPLAGFQLPERARLLFQYDFVRDYLGRDELGVPADAENDQWTVRLQVQL